MSKGLYSSLGGYDLPSLSQVVSVSNAGNLSIDTSTWTALAFDTTVADPRDLHTTGASTRITFKQSGIYLIGAEIFWDATAGGALKAFEIYANGFGVTIVSRGRIEGPVGATNVGQHLSAIRKMDIDDYVEVWVFQNTGGAQDVLSAALFWAVRLSKAQS